MINTRIQHENKSDPQFECGRALIVWIRSAMLWFRQSLRRCLDHININQWVRIRVVHSYPSTCLLWSCWTAFLYTTMTALKPCDMVAFCKRMPKIELHAHLNGSVSRETIRHLISMQPSNATLQADFATFEKQCSLTSIHSFFPLFKFVYAVSNCIANVRYITRQVIVEFSTDGCEYLELRSTPRSNPETDLVSKRTYIEACLAGTKDAIEMLKGAIQVRWILSLDRRHSLEDGLETVQLAKEFMDQGVVGVDLCGEPSAGNFKDLEPAFIQAREAGLKVTLHVAEIKNHEQETRDMIHFMPDRIGHGTFLKDALREHVVDNAIPIEACVTSNLLCKTVERIEDHHFNGFYFEGHPCIPCASIHVQKNIEPF